MIRKLIFRAFLVGTALTCILVAGIAIGGYLAFRQPAFYAELRANTVADAAVDAEMQAKTDALEEWAMRVNADRRQGTNHSSTHVLELSEKQLNTQLASEHFSAGDMRHPRVQLLDDKLRLGAELHLNEHCFVLSADLKPSITENELRLEIQNAYLGTLQLPVYSLLKAMSEHVKNTDPKFRLDVSGRTPAITVNLSKHDRKPLNVKSILCLEGSVAIEFEPRAINESAGERISNQTEQHYEISRRQL